MAQTEHGELSGSIVKSLAFFYGEVLIVHRCASVEPPLNHVQVKLNTERETNENKMRRRNNQKTQAQECLHCINWVAVNNTRGRTGGVSRGVKGAVHHWFEERNVKHGVNLENCWQCQANSTGVDDPFNEIGADVAWHQLPGDHLEGKVPGRQPDLA